MFGLHNYATPIKIGMLALALGFAVWTVMNLHRRLAAVEQKTYAQCPVPAQKAPPRPGSRRASRKRSPLRLPDKAYESPPPFFISNANRPSVTKSVVLPAQKSEPQLLLHSNPSPPAVSQSPELTEESMNAYLQEELKVLEEEGLTQECHLADSDFETEVEEEEEDFEPEDLQPVPEL